ncbi:hypothetical protein HYS90_01580 [Candidatus Curtissbacteria bacterium]|nr:hypothetical protein [Candidatus Curtissbacteria bacterium]
MFSMEIEAGAKKILEDLTSAGFEAAIVGGAVRDILMGKKVQDWDFATNAKPQEIQKIFPKSFYSNRFGTVGIVVGSETFEITTYRMEQKYTDRRHPDVIVWTQTLEEDLARRDFTINAIALRLRSGQALRYAPAKGEARQGRQGKSLDLVDPFDGQKDLKNKIVRTVGDPNERFAEDALRLLRAVRFAATLDFAIEKKTLAAIKKNARLLEGISGERVSLMSVLVSSRKAQSATIFMTLAPIV